MMKLRCDRVSDRVSDRIEQLRPIQVLPLIRHRLAVAHSIVQMQSFRIGGPVFMLVFMIV